MKDMMKMLMMGKKITWRLVEEQQQQLQLVEQLPVEPQHPGEMLNCILHSSYIILSHVLECRQAWVGGCVQGRRWCRKPGGPLPVAAHGIVSLDGTSLTLKLTWTGKPEVIDPARVVASETG